MPFKNYIIILFSKTLEFYTFSVFLKALSLMFLSAGKTFSNLLIFKCPGVRTAIASACPAASCRLFFNINHSINQQSCHVAYIQKNMHKYSMLLIFLLNSLSRIGDQSKRIQTAAFGTHRK